MVITLPSLITQLNKARERYLDLVSQTLVNDSYNTDKNITIIRLMPSNEQLQPFMSKNGWYTSIINQRNTGSNTSGGYYANEGRYGIKWYGFNESIPKSATSNYAGRCLVPVFEY